MDGVHDMGGMHGFGPVVVEGGDAVFHEDWEARVFALHHLSIVRGLVGGPSGRAVRGRWTRRTTSGRLLALAVGEGTPPGG
jgi:hypothetical protein